MATAAKIEQEIETQREANKLLDEFRGELLRRYGYERLKKYIEENLTYISYRQSPMWNITSRIKRQLVGHCETCGAKYNLQIHHLTYEHLGIEIFHMEDLQVLCDSCHKREHGIFRNLPYYTVKEVLFQLLGGKIFDETGVVQ